MVGILYESKFIEISLSTVLCPWETDEDCWEGGKLSPPGSPLKLPCGSIASPPPQEPGMDCWQGSQVRLPSRPPWSPPGGSMAVGNLMTAVGGVGVLEDVTLWILLTLEQTLIEMYLSETGGTTLLYDFKRHWLGLFDGPVLHWGHAISPVRN